MNHYKYKPNNNEEIDLIKEKCDILKERKDIIVYSLSNIELRDIKVDASKGDVKNIKMKKIIFESNVIRQDEIFELLLADDNLTDIDKALLNKPKK